MPASNQPYVVGVPGLQYPYISTPPAYDFGHQIPQIPTLYQTHMPVPIPYMNIPPPFPAPGNIYYPSLQIYNPNSFLLSVDTHPLQGQRIIAGAQAPRPRHSHTGRMTDGKNFRSVSRVNRHSRGRVTCIPESEDGTVMAQKMVQQEREQPRSSPSTTVPGSPILSDEGQSVLPNVPIHDSVMDVCSPGTTCKDSPFMPEILLSRKVEHTVLNRSKHCIFLVGIWSDG